MIKKLTTDKEGGNLAFSDKMFQVLEKSEVLFSVRNIKQNL